MSALAAWALIRRQAYWLTVVLAAAVPAQAMWIVDFVLELFGRGMGRTAFLMECGPVILAASVVTHLLLIPAALAGVLKLGYHRKAWQGVLLSGALISLGTLLLTPVWKNVNCAFYPCDTSDPGSGYGVYFLLNFWLMWSAIGVISFFMGRMIFHKRLVPAEGL